MSDPKDYTTELADGDLISAFEEIKAIKAQINLLDSEKRIIEDWVRDKMLSHEIMADNNGEVIATYKPCIRTSINTEAIKKDLPLVYEKYVIRKESRILLIK